MARLVIVGMGAAGFAAAETIRRHQSNATITAISDDSHGYYSRPGLAYALTGEVPEKRLFPIDRRRWNELDVEQINGRVIRLQPSSRELALTDGRRLTYDALLLATGAHAVEPDLPGIDQEGVVVLDSMEDMRHILRLARRAREAVVIGGGITALEIVEGLRAQKVRVHYLMRGDRFWRSVLDESESKIIEDRLIKEGVRIHHHSELARIVSRQDWRGRQRLSEVITKDGREIRCQIVGVAIGVRPRLELVAGTGIESDRGILVNDRLETSVPGIYAAGDAAQVCDPITGRAQLDVLWPVAVAQGRVAGANMAGVPTVYERNVPLNVTRLAGLLVTLIGAVGSRREPDADLVSIARGDSEVWRGIPDVIVVHDQHEVNRQRLVLQGNRLVGAIIIGDQSSSPLVSRLIREQVDIGPYLPSLQAPHAHLAEILPQIERDLGTRDESARDLIALDRRGYTEGRL